MEKHLYILEHYAYHISDYDLIMDLLDDSLYLPTDVEELHKIATSMNLNPTETSIQEACNDWVEANPS